MDAAQAGIGTSMATLAQANGSFIDRSVSQGMNQAYLFASEMTPDSLGSRREGFVSSGGYSLMDSWAEISSLPNMLRYFPRALAIGLLAPFPWQWFDVRGSTGPMRALASLDMLLVYFLFPSVVASIWNLVKQRRVEGFFFLGFILLMVGSISLVVANLGTLFRLRLQFLLPLLILASGSNPITMYARILGWVGDPFRIRRNATQQKRALIYAESAASTLKVSAPPLDGEP